MQRPIGAAARPDALGSRITACIAALAALAPAAVAAARALGPDQAALVGAWESKSARNVVALIIQPVEGEACPRLVSEGAFDLADHPSLRGGLFWKVHRLKPGRYAIAAVRWGAGSYPASTHGQSRQTGPLWTFTVAPGQVTDIGVWRILPRYAEAYTVEGFDIAGSVAEARARAERTGPVAQAQPVREKVADGKAGCGP